MTDIFGLSVTSLAIGVGIAVGVVLGIILLFAWRRPLVVRMGLRNIPRRRAQTVLIVFGLTLATIIVTMAFSTGDTMTISIRESAYDGQYRIDHMIAFDEDDAAVAADDDRQVSQRVLEDVQAEIAGDDRADGAFGALIEPVGVINLDTRLSEPLFWMVGADAADVDAAGAIPDEDWEPLAMSGVGADEIVVSRRAADQLAAEPGHTLRLFAGEQRIDLRVAAIGADTVMTGVFQQDEGGGTVRIGTARAALGDAAAPDMWTFIAIATGNGSLDAGLDYADEFNDGLSAFLDGRAQAERAGLADDEIGDYYSAAAGSHRLEANDSKADAVANADLFGAVLVLLFLFMGSFSVAAGVLLIFLIFAMLAEERRSEMGISRAIGMQRDHLIQMFMSEGMAYNMGAAVIGVLLGLAVTVGMVQIINTGLEAFGFTFRWSVTWQSLITSGGIGVIITFLTMTVSSFRASVLNIVAAIRDLPDSGSASRRRISLPGIFTTPIGLVLLPTLPLTFIFGSLFVAIAGASGGLRASTVPRILAPAWWLMTWRAEWWPIMLVGGIAVALYGVDRESLFFYMTGVSLAPLGLVMLVTRLGVPGRPLWTAASALVLFFWLVPNSWHEDVLGINLNGGPELFVISGMAMTAAGSLLIVFNLETLVRVFSIGLARAGKYAPVLRAAAAYPAASRYRTGMTIAMIGLIVFALVNFTVVNTSFTRSTGTDDQLAGYAIQAESTTLDDVSDISQALREAGATETLADISKTGALTAGPLSGTPVQTLIREEWDALANLPVGGVGSPRVLELSGDEDESGNVVLISPDGAFLGDNEIVLQAWVRDYASSADAWEALASGEPVAIAGQPAIGEDPFGAGDSWGIPGVENNTTRLPRQTIRIGYEGGRTVEVAVIGVLPTLSFEAFAAPGSGGQTSGPILLVPRAVWDQVLDEPDITRHLVGVQGGADSLEVAQAIESTLFVQARDLAGEAARNQRLTNAFLRAFQIFIGIGLAAGLAALGVIAVRAVVERRGQIGVLRSLGFRSRMVGLQMLLEMGFIALLGVLLGTALALALAWRLFAEDTFGPGISMYVPWGTVIAFAAGAMGAALLLTYLPARQAANTPIAEALRYE